MKIHGIPAQSWQLEAAKDLKAIILPLTGGWVSGDPRGWLPIEALGSGFEVGDRIYLQEEWCDLREYFSRKDAFTLKSELKENCHNQAGVDALEMASLWQPAHTMPPEAAQHWYTVTEVRVVQMDEIDSELCHKAGLSDVALAPDTDIDTVGRVWAGIFMCWNKGNSEHFWQDDRWVVVLSVEAIAG
jgi:hypothetical protein